MTTPKAVCAWCPHAGGAAAKAVSTGFCPQVSPAVARLKRNCRSWVREAARCKSASSPFGTVQKQAETTFVSGNAKDFSERVCDLGTGIFRVVADAGSGASVASVPGGGVSV